MKSSAPPICTLCGIVFTGLDETVSHGLKLHGTTKYIKIANRRDDILCELLLVDAPSPEILLEYDGGDLHLDWQVLNVSISPRGEISWAFYDGKRKENGTDIKRVKELIAEQESLWQNRKKNQ